MSHLQKILCSVSGHSTCIRVVRADFYGEIVESCRSLIKVTDPQHLYSIWDVTSSELFKNVVVQMEKFQQILDVTMKTFVPH